MKTSFVTNGKRKRLKLRVKKALFPGMDLHTHCRYRFLPELIAAGDLCTLDAGLGNGALSLAAYRKGNRVVGLSYLPWEAEGTTAFFEYLGIPQERAAFHTMNLYDLRKLNRKFDQIICSETLEHIARDREVISMFADLLNPAGKLVICCPYSRHPEHALGRTNEPEDGGHVRDGYTIETYEALLNPLGFRIEKTLGLGSPLLCFLDKILRNVRHHLGDAFSLPLFFLLWPLTRLDYKDPAKPFSLAVLAEKHESKCESA